MDNKCDAELLDAKERYDQAHGALSAAEELAWPIAIMSAVLAHVGWPNWHWTLLIAIGGGAFYLATFTFRRNEQRCESEYHKLARLVCARPGRH